MSYPALTDGIKLSPFSDNVRVGIQKHFSSLVSQDQRSHQLFFSAEGNMVKNHHDVEGVSFFANDNMPRNTGLILLIAFV